MNTADNIIHKGIVTAVRKGVIYVSFIQEGGCSACSARSACTMTETAHHVLRLPSAGRDINVGQEVTVSITPEHGYRAVVLSYVIPVVIMLSVLGLTLQADVAEPTAALLSLGALIPYFGLLKLFSRHFANDISYEVVKQ